MAIHTDIGIPFIVSTLSKCWWFQNWPSLLSAAVNLAESIKFTTNVVVSSILSINRPMIGKVVEERSKYRRAYLPESNEIAG